AFRRASLRSGRVKRRWPATRSLVSALTLVISSHSLNFLNAAGTLAGFRKSRGGRRPTLVCDGAHWHDSPLLLLSCPSRGSVSMRPERNCGDVDPGDALIGRKANPAQF